MSPAAERRGLPVRLVVLDHDGGDLTLRCLEHLRALEQPEGGLEIVCVDNASSDGNPERIRREHPDVTVIALDRNEGFGANNHALVDLGGVRYVGLVNNDAFVDPGWLGPLVDALDADPGLGAVCPRMLLEPRFAPIAIEAPPARPGRADRRTVGVRVTGVRVDGVDVSDAARLGPTGWGRETDRHGAWEWSKPQSTVFVPAPPDVVVEVRLVVDAPTDALVRFDGGRGVVERRVGRESVEVSVPVGAERVDLINNVGALILHDGYGSDRGWLEIDDGRFDAPVDVAAWNGGGVLLRPEYLADVGLFDPRFFLYYEDTDLSWRGLARGWRYRTVPSARIRHVHSASTGSASDLSMVLTERNRLLMLVRNARASFVLSQFALHVRATASYAVRDIVGPILRGRRPRPTVVARRTRSFLGALQALPWALASRRRLRRRRLVVDREVERSFTSR